MTMKTTVLRDEWRFILILATLSLGACDNNTTDLEANYHVSLGTSLAAGVQVDANGVSQLTNDGYADQLFGIIKPLFDAIAPEIRELQPHKLGCPAETTITMIAGGICPYAEGSQLDAAVAFLTAQGDKVELITIDMGANDLLRGNCIVLDIAGGQLPTAVDFICIQDVSAQISANLSIILTALSQAAAPGTLIVGMNYYNPFLALWLAGPEGQVLAMDSATAVGIVNDGIDLTYAQFAVPVADVSGAFQSDDFVTQVSFPLPAPNDLVPVNVSLICLLTYMCQPPPVGPDIHANTAGYAKIAIAFVGILPY
ncbi:MAG: hypothetical protein V3R83_00010 [Gammaproteobacteria bacterium]